MSMGLGVRSEHSLAVCSPLQGQGQAIDFYAFDLYQVNAQGRISDNWHLEDNLTLLRQLGVLPQ